MKPNTKKDRKENNRLIALKFIAASINMCISIYSGCKLVSQDAFTQHVPLLYDSVAFTSFRKRTLITTNSFANLSWPAILAFAFRRH